MVPETRKIVDLAAKCAYDKKGTDIVILDMVDQTLICDAFVIISGSSRPHTKAIAEHIEYALRDELGEIRRNRQTKEEGSWVLLDYGIVVIHVFLENMRKYYNIEGLWDKAPQERPYPDEDENDASITSEKAEMTN